MFSDSGTMVIRVKKDELLKRLQENRDKHREVFEAALNGYREYAEELLRGTIEDLKRGRVPDIKISVSRPEDHTRDYDRVIGMLKMHQGEEFDLDETTYAQYVDDDWSWKRQWLRLSSEYAAGATIANYGSAALQ